jgi:hypothetical protein
MKFMLQSTIFGLNPILNNVKQGEHMSCLIFLLRNNKWDQLFVQIFFYYVLELLYLYKGGEKIL